MSRFILLLFIISIMNSCGDRVAKRQTDPPCFTVEQLYSYCIALKGNDSATFTVSLDDGTECTMIYQGE